MTPTQLKERIEKAAMEHRPCGTTFECGALLGARLMVEALRERAKEVFPASKFCAEDMEICADYLASLLDGESAGG
jgi:hypothetical protein